MIKTFSKILLDLIPIEIEEIQWIHSRARNLEVNKVTAVVDLEEEYQYLQQVKCWNRNIVKRPDKIILSQLKWLNNHTSDSKLTKYLSFKLSLMSSLSHTKRLFYQLDKRQLTIKIRLVHLEEVFQDKAKIALTTKKVTKLI